MKQVINVEQNTATHLQKLLERCLWQNQGHLSLPVAMLTHNQAYKLGKWTNDHWSEMSKAERTWKDMLDKKKKNSCMLIWSPQTLICSELRVSCFSIPLWFINGATFSCECILLLLFYRSIHVRLKHPSPLFSLTYVTNKNSWFLIVTISFYIKQGFQYHGSRAGWMFKVFIQECLSIPLILSNASPKMTALRHHHIVWLKPWVYSQTLNRKIIETDLMRQI